MHALSVYSVKQEGLALMAEQTHEGSQAPVKRKGRSYGTSIDYYFIVWLHACVYRKAVVSCACT